MVPAVGCRRVVEAEVGRFPLWRRLHSVEGQRWAGQDSEPKESRCSPDQRGGHLQQRGGTQKLKKKDLEMIEQKSVNVMDVGLDLQFI